MPPIFHGVFRTQVLGTSSGIVILVGVGVCLLGIAIAGFAGMSKEREMTETQKREIIKEFNFRKGILVAVFSGVMSACFAYGLDAAQPIADLSLAHGTPPLWTGLPKLCVVLLGGFTTNCVWCVLLSIQNKTGYQYLASRARGERPPEGQMIIETAIDAPGEEVVKHMSPTPPDDGRAVPLLANYLFSALAGVTWYLQFFFYTMGETQMGRYKFSSWTLHMASIIIFSSLWGIGLSEWKGSSGFTKALLFLGLATLVFSTVVVGYGNFLGAASH